MHIRPRFSGPIKKPLAPSKFITQVDEPLMPILSSIEPQLTPLRSAKVPSATMLYLGTINNEIPLVPSGALGRRANTICTIWSVKSCSPDEIKIFVPVILNEPSALGSALVFTWPRSVPHCGSVKHIVPNQVPSAIGGR